MRTRAPYAASAAHSRGRRYPEEAPRYRSEYQRDRDRIIHSTAFRRLEYKTQVFVNHEGDLFRTRLTHSLEVAQLSRTIANALGLDEALCEAVALAHDLGHTPFGHAGQHALNECMKDYGGFEHNLQSLRVVDQLEQRYAAFDGLNLSFETREGILKHCARKDAEQLGDVGERFLHGTQPGLEAQVVNIADAIAYNNHDTDDGLRACLFSPEDLDQHPLFGEHYRGVKKNWPELAPRRMIHETIRRMINAQVTDLIETSQAAIDAAKPADIEAVRGAGKNLIGFSKAMREAHLELKRFLHNSMYKHYRVHRMSVKSQYVIKRLFDAFNNDTALLPPEPRERIAPRREESGAESRQARVIADYIAGMTDRYAIAEYERLFNTTTLP